MVAGSNSDPTVRIDIRVAPSAASRMTVGAADSKAGEAGSDAGAETEDFEVVGESRSTRLWRRALEYHLRLAKQKVFWWAGGTALRWISERRKQINQQIDRELKV